MSNPFVDPSTSNNDSDYYHKHMHCTRDLIYPPSNALLNFKRRIKSSSSCIKLHSYQIELNETCVALESHDAIDCTITIVDILRQ